MQIINLDNELELGSAINSIIQQDPSRPKFIRLVSDVYQQTTPVNLYSGWKVFGYGNGQVNPITTIETSVDGPAFKMGEVGRAAARSTKIGDFTAISKNDKPAFRLMNCIESLATDITVLSANHPSFTDHGTAVELIGGARHGVYKSDVQRVEVIGFHDAFYIEGDATGSKNRRCNGNALISCRSDSGVNGISISGCDHIDIISHRAESNTGAGLKHRAPINRAFSLRTNLIGGRFENKSKGGVDFHTVHSSPGGAGFTKLYGTRWGNKNDPNNRLVIT